VTRNQASTRIFCEVRIAFNRQSKDILQGVDRQDGTIGAGDQGIMFGYACDETPQFMPMSIWLAHRLVEQQALLRKTGELPWLRPDAKSQVTVCYEGSKLDRLCRKSSCPRSTRPISISIPFAEKSWPASSSGDLRVACAPGILNTSSTPPAASRSAAAPMPTPASLAARSSWTLTEHRARTAVAHSPAKDPTKVDRSAAYIARNVAKTVVASGIARRCTLQLSYAIGVAQPLSVHVDVHGTGTADEDELERAIREEFDLTPAGIIRELKLTAADLSEDRGLRGILAPARRVHLGANAARRGAAQAFAPASVGEPERAHRLAKLRPTSCVVWLIRVK
jgi:S-adenosylmethionine synthetase